MTTAGSDNAGKPNEGAAVPDMSKFVPKEDAEKLSTSLKEMEAKLDEAKLALLDPEYVAFKESKAGKQVTRAAEKVAESMSEDELDKLSSRQLLTLAIEEAAKQITAKYEPVLSKIGHTQQDILAVLELQAVEKKYKDFDSYRDDVAKVLDTSTTPLTIEQAYKLAKANKIDDSKEKSEDEKAEEARAGREKPGGSVPGQSVQKKSFESPREAALDAWDAVVGKGKGEL